MPILELVAVVTALKPLAEFAVSGELQALIEFAVVLYGNLEAHKENKNSWTVLANSSLHILQSLNGVECSSSSLEQQVKRIRVFHEQIHSYYQESVVKCHKVIRVFKAASIRNQIKEFSEELNLLWKDVMLVLSIDIVNKLDETVLRDAMCQDEAREQAYLDRISSMLLDNNAVILEELDIRLNQQEWKIRQATDALQRIIYDDAVIENAIKKAVEPLLKMIQNQSRVSRSMKREEWRIDSSRVEYRSIDAIGCGGFGKVYIASYFGAPVAVKELFCTIGEGDEMDEFRREIGIWHKLKHPHVLPLLGACDTTEKPFMISPYMSGGTLWAYVSNRDIQRDLHEKLRILYEVASGMAYLHGNDIIHGDIKSMNVLLDKNFHAVISDFGLSRAKYTSSSSVSAALVNNSIGGTLQYMAPEMLDFDYPAGSSKKTDVYAYGIMFYEVMINGGDIWRTADGRPLNIQRIALQVSAGKRPKRHANISDDVWAVIEECWHQESKQRPCFEDVLLKIQKLLPPSPSEDSLKPIVASVASNHEVSDSSNHSLSAGSGVETVATKSDLSLVQEVTRLYDIPSSTRAGLHEGAPDAYTQAAKEITRGKSATDSCWSMAVRLYEKACEVGDVQSCYELAWLHFSGIGVDRSEREAFEYWQDVKDKSNDAILRTISTYMVGLCHYFGVGTDLDLVTGWRLIIESRSDDFAIGGKWAFSWGWDKSTDEIQSTALVSNAFWERVSFGSANNSLLKHLEGVCYFYGFGVSKDQNKAVQIFTTLAHNGFAASELLLGLCYYHGYTAPMSRETAVEWFQKSSEQGYSWGQDALAYCYWNGAGFHMRYPKKAVEWYLKAAEQGNAEAQYNLASVLANEAEAFKWCQKAAEQGVAEAQRLVGFCYTQGLVVPHDPAKALKWLQKAAAQGLADPQLTLYLGMSYFHAQDYVNAVEWFHRAADQGDVNAQFFLGMIFYRGHGVSEDRVIAAKWFKDAAVQGHADAQNIFAYCNYYGHGVPQNYAEAAKWFQMAANQGQACAQNNLGTCYYSGHGVPQNYVNAVEWYQKSADQGDASAQYSLGNCYYGGRGVTHNYTEAVKWHRKAADQGYVGVENKESWHVTAPSTFEV